jgi:hypothetical protein
MVDEINPETSFRAQSPVVGRHIKGRLDLDDAVVYDLQINLATDPTVRTCAANGFTVIPHEMLLFVPAFSGLPFS